MSDESTEQGSPDQPPKAEIRPPRHLSIVWFIPLVVAAVAGWVGYKTFSEKGTAITITFETAEGLEAGKTKILYKGVHVGIVDAIHVGEDISRVTVYATIIKDAAIRILNKDTQFWVVRPRFSFTGISGLSTLISGDYITVQPGGGVPTTNFKGLNKPPSSGYDGRTFTVHAERLGSIHVAAPVYHSGIPVGKVLKYRFAKGDAGVDIQILIDKKYADLVRRNSVFWNVSGIDLELGNLFDASVRVGSLENLLAGGMAFASPPEAAAPALADAVFTLHDKRPTSILSHGAAQGLKLVLTTKKLGGVKAGDNITYRQLGRQGDQDPTDKERHGGRDRCHYRQETRGARAC